MTDWREHNGGPQPVADDVWVEVLYSGGVAGRIARAGNHMSLVWKGQRFKWRILNGSTISNLIDAARLDGIRLGLEAAEQAALKAEDTLDNEWRAGGRYDSYLEGRSDGMGEAADLIRNINPDTIAREAVLDQLTREAQADNMGYAKEAKDD